MAAGDLITKDYQYEFRGMLIGSGTGLIIKRVKGMLHPPAIEAQDRKRQDAHGTLPGRVTYSDRRIEFDIAIDSVGGLPVESTLQQLFRAYALNEKGGLDQFVFQRPNGFGKRFCWARLDDSDFESDFEVAHGLSLGSVALLANDPRYYSLEEFTDNLTIINGNVNGAATVVNNGSVGSAPVLEIDGPATNPRITNLDDDNRQLKLDLTIAAGQTLIVDAKGRTVSLAGANYYRYMRVDSQWWKLQPGDNHLTYSRTDNGAGSTIRVRHRGAWMA